MMARYEIEIEGEKNESTYFPPLGEVRLRGVWRSSRVAMFDKSEAMKSMSAIERIPGYRIACDDDTFVGEVYDPLNETEDGQRVFSQVKSVIERYKEEFGEITGLRDKIVKKLDADSLKDWLYWMRRKVEAGLAKPVAGSAELLDLETVRSLPGKRRTDPFNTGQQTSKREDDGRLPKYTDAVKVPDKYGPTKQPAAAGSK